jgi:hypothetical protein
MCCEKNGQRTSDETRPEVNNEKYWGGASSSSSSTRAAGQLHVSHLERVLLPVLERAVAEVGKDALKFAYLRANSVVRKDPSIGLDRVEPGGLFVGRVRGGGAVGRVLGVDAERRQAVERGAGVGGGRRHR